MSSFIAWSGSSVLDGSPIMLIVTGVDGSSDNSKTGGEVQTYILRSDVSPTDAIKSGADVSICGDCKHRGTIVDGVLTGRDCYVRVFHAPLSIYKAFHRGSYALAPVASLAGKVVRLGSYGDPAAVPFEVWAQLLQGVRATTGYTHQWHHARFAPFAAWCMASVDTPQEYLAAKRSGWRTFRVRKAGEPSMPRELPCPASHEAGRRTTCDKCIACGGNGAKAKADIVINQHR
jgi:hypothetical protein